MLRFVHFLYWRIPENDTQLDKLIEEKTFEETGFDIINKTTGESAATIELQNKLKDIDLFRKMYRISIPLLSSKKEYSKTDIENWRLYTRWDGKNIAGDSPIVIEKFIDFGSLNEEDMMLLQQATRYVYCSNKQYLELLINDLYSFSKNYDFRDKMKQTVFSHFA